MKHKNIFSAGSQKGLDNLHQDLKYPRLVDKMDPPDPQGEAAGEKCRGEANLVNTQVSEEKIRFYILFLETSSC